MPSKRADFAEEMVGTAAFKVGVDARNFRALCVHLNSNPIVKISRSALVMKELVWSVSSDVLVVMCSPKKSFNQ